MKAQISKNIKTIKNYENSLKRIEDKWDTLSLLSEMSDTGIDISETQKSFSNLSKKVKNNLIEENFKRLESDYKSKSGMIIDILTRNLFERTADVGFLATDKDIINFILSEEKNHEKMKNRLNEYISKYSVYENVLIFDLHNNVLCDLNGVTSTKNKRIKETLISNNEYCEFYEEVDFNQNKKTLFYTKSITNNGKKIGILCLVFKIENEMKTIFSKIKQEDYWFELLLLDQNNKVIESTDTEFINKDKQLNIKEGFSIIKFKGNEYLIYSSLSNGYQGYKGLGFKGTIMTPLQYVFEESFEEVDKDTLNKVIEHSELLSEDLREIPILSDSIQGKLKSTLWKGNLNIIANNSGDNKLKKTLLNEVEKMGLNTKEVFDKAIGKLDETIVKGFFEKANIQAELCVEVFDRNLYERANDCRWWSLTDSFIKDLNNPENEKILEYINELYTVYTDIAIFNEFGEIIHISNSKDLKGSFIKEYLLTETLRQNSSQEYSVSKFEKSELYKNKETYIYTSSINNGIKNIGGIAVIFDSEPEFNAICKETKDNNWINLLVSENKTIISSSETNIYKVGDIFELSKNKTELRLINGDYYIIGFSISDGYREFKNEDSYSDNVTGVSMLKIGSYKESLNLEHITKYSYEKSGECLNLSTFILNKQVYAFETKDIKSLLTEEKINKVIGAKKHYLGLVIFEGSAIPVISLKELLGFKEDNKELRNIIVLKYENNLIGVVVDEIHESPLVSKSSLKELEKEYAKYTKNLIYAKENGKEKAVSLLDIEKIVKSI